MEMGLLDFIGLGEKQKICAGCGELAVPREHRWPNLTHAGSPKYWGCPHGQGRFCCKPENEGKRKEINAVWLGKKRYKYFRSACLKYLWPR
jgi:hypothetical protein